MDRPLIALDTETATCRGAPHLLELGAVRIVDGEVADHFESLVRPEVPIDEEALSIHGIADEDVQGAPPAAEVLAAFLEWAGDDWLAAHNARFDAKVLGYESARSGLAFPDSPFVDSLNLARKCLPEAPNHRLETLTEVLEIEVTVHHRALADAVSCWKVIEACAATLAAPVTAAALLALSGRPTSVPAARPAPPAHFHRRHRPLQAALRDGTDIVLHYGERIGTPSRLPVFPRMLYQHRDKSYLEAECRLSGLLKTYRLDRVQRVETA